MIENAMSSSTFTRYVALRLCAMACVLFGAAKAPAQDVTGLVKAIKPSVVSVLTYDASGEEYTHGSGFFIGRYEILTSRHVVVGSANVRVVTSDERTFDVDGVVGEDINGDLVVLKVHLPDTSNVPALIISDSLPEEGERIIVIGNPLGYDRSVADGLVSAVRADTRVGHRIQMSVPVSRGSSGSPVVNSRGQVIGVATSSVEAGQNINFAMPAQRIHAMSRTDVQTLSAWNASRKPGTLSPVSALFFLGRSAFRNDSLESAVRHFEEAITLDKDDADSWHWLGRCREKLGDNEGAVKAYMKSASLSPTGNTYWRLGDVLARMRDEDGAIAAYLTACQQLPNDTLVHYSLAVAFYNADRLDDAIAASKEVVRIDPKNVDAKILLGETYNRTARYADAVGILLEAIQLRDTSLKAHDELSRSYESTGEFAKSSVECHYVVGRAPNDAAAWSHLGSVEDHLGHLDSALAAYSHASELAPDDEVFHYNICVFACNHAKLAVGRIHYRWLKERKSTIVSQVAPCYEKK